MSSIIKRLYPVTAAPEFGSPAEYDRLREDLVEAGDEEVYDLSGIRPVAHAMSYSYLLDAAYIPKAALALGCSPTVRDFVAFVVKHPAALSPVACGEAGVLMVGATSTEEGWVQVYPSGSTAERFLGQALLVYENEPEAPELARRMGEPAYALRYPGLHQSSEYMTLAGGVCADLGKFGGAAVVPTLELPAEVAEITGRLVVPSDQSTRSAIAAAVLSAQDLWRKDKDGLPEGQCYLACFRPGVRAAVLEVLKNSPTVYHFFLLYAMGYKRGWLVDASWNLRVLAKGMLHLERGVLVRGMLPYDGLSMAWLGTVGHGDRACQLLNPFSELCGSCGSHSKTPWAGKIRECGCGSSGSAKDLLAHKDVMKAASTIEFDAVMAIRVTQDGRAVFTHKVPVDEIKQGVSGFARVCNDMTKLGKVPVGVTTYVYLVAKDPELILPPKVRCYVAGAWVSTDRPTSILGSGSLLVGFSDVREHTLLPYKSRDWDQVIRWHHMRARTDPTETDSRFYTAMVCHLVVYSALPFAGGGYGSAIPMRRVPPEGGYECGDAHVHGGSGEAKVAPYGSVISSLGPTIQVGNVALGPGVKLGIGPRIRRYSVVVHRDGWPEFDPAWMVEDGNDDYDIDGGGPSGSDGMFGSAY